MLLEEIDFRKTKNGARRVLKQYRRLERIAGRSAIDLCSPIVSDMPKTETIGNQAENAILQKIDAEAERDEIVTALLALSLTSRQVLYYSFCTVNRYSNLGIAGELDYSIRTIEDYKSIALMEFAEAYRGGKLITRK